MEIDYNRYYCSCNLPPLLQARGRVGDAERAAVVGHFVVAACERRMIVVAGSGRAADGLVALLEGTTPKDGEVADLRARAEKARLAGRPELYTVVPMATGAAGLRAALDVALVQKP